MSETKRGACGLSHSNNLTPMHKAAPDLYAALEYADDALVHHIDCAAADPLEEGKPCDCEIAPVRAEIIAALTKAGER